VGRDYLVNPYRLWKYFMGLVALLVGSIYTLPNFCGKSPAVQISSVKSTVRVEPSTMNRVESILQDAGITHTGIQFDQNGPVGTVRVRFETTDTQLQARDLLEQRFNPDPADPDYVVALNLLPSSPNWLTALGARPMYLGLDLRGGVHFLLQVDMEGALTKRYDTLATDARAALRGANVRTERIEREGQGIVVVADAADASRVNDVLR